MAIVPLLIEGRELRPHKCIVAPLLATRTVLTNSPWEFVELWLKREKKLSALFFWKQAREFHVASRGMGLESAPLLHYYSFMNAAKALLEAKGVAFEPIHGVRSHNLRPNGERPALSNEGIRILSRGVLPALSTYLGETESENIHNLQDVLFNLPYIHRTYCLTFKNQNDMFLPLANCRYLLDDSSMNAYFAANLSADLDHKRFIKRLPPTMVKDGLGSGDHAIRSVSSFTVSRPVLKTASDRSAATSFSRSIRSDLNHINGVHTLWYVKGMVSGPKRLNRFPATLTLAAMHRLSEICRYRPTELASFLSGQKNWLLSEFISMAPQQFIDALAAEITGHQFLTPNVRSAS
jgi:hypothetical protein